MPEPTAADLEAFHMTHGNDMFSSPEYRSFDYVTIRPDEVSKEIEVSDADLQMEYNSNKAQYEVAEQRDIEQIVFPDKAAADAAAARIKTPADFTAIARERGLSADDQKLGTFTATTMDARLRDAAFMVAAGATTQPLQGPFGLGDSARGPRRAWPVQDVRRGQRPNPDKSRQSAGAGEDGRSRQRV